jgi:nicotinate-nucleotide adenylyltransferase
VGGLDLTKRIGYFGGTFDPPHIGHQVLASEALYQAELDSLMWILTPKPPHKSNQSLSSEEHRLAMLQMMIKLSPQFSISQIDMDRDPPHYAADTVEMLKKQDPYIELVYLVGEDSLRDLSSWYQPERFLDNIDQLCVARRPGISVNLDEISPNLPGLKDKVVYLTGTMLQVSSSLIRKRVFQNAPYKHLVIPEVHQYIEGNNLYRE